MAHFYGRIKGQTAEITRTGSKKSGMYSSVGSYELGGHIDIRYDSITKKDILTTYAIVDGIKQKIASFSIVDGKLEILETNYPELLV